MIPTQGHAPEVVSFGCRLNLVEGEAIRRAARAAGRENLVIVNSCGVTGEAARQARQAIRRLKRDQPDRAIVVTGCASEMEPDRFAAMPEVNGIIGNRAKTERASWLIPPPPCGEGSGVGVTPFFADTETSASTPTPSPSPQGGGEALLLPESPLLAGTEDHTRAFLAVQNGCDHSCTFCAIPLGRGASRSASIVDVVVAARRLAEAGFREIVLTGVDLTSYGGDLPETPTLGRLVRAILRGAPALERLRLSSIDCIEADPELRAAFAEEERLMPYLHLSLQSGDDMILKRMKRRHTRAEAIAICADLRRLRPDMTFGADLIAGFPTETDAMAEATSALIEDCGLTFLHVFPFSPRPGTPAARMPPVAPGLAKARAKSLREAGDRALRRHFRSQIGRTIPVLAERGGMGRAPDFTPVAVGSLLPGTIGALTIAGHDGRKLIGRPAHAI